MAGQRKTTGERLETLRQKQDRLKAQLDALASQKRAEDRRRETRRAFVVGAAALACAEADPAFREALQKALQSSVTRETDKAMIGLQPALPSPAPSAPAVELPAGTEAA
jgi:DNA-binding transcriptional regulator YbjK